MVLHMEIILCSRIHRFLRRKSGEKEKRATICGSSVVDDTRLELVTSRTSSGCATSCANRPCLKGKGYSITADRRCQELFALQALPL